MWVISCPYKKYDKRYWKITSHRHFGVDLVFRIDGMNQTELQKIRTFEDGRVVFICNNANSNSGLMVVLKTNGYCRSYHHLSSIYVTMGARLKKGDLIGLAGKTGTQCTGPHGHFDKYYYGKKPKKGVAYMRADYSTPVYYVDPEITAEMMNEINST